jgi:uncharacterized protein YkwD
LGIVLAVLPGIATARTSAAPNDCTVTDWTLDSEELSLIAAINSYRASHGLGQLTVNAALERTATWMATDLATRTGFSHVDSLGREFWVRDQDCGYALAGGENIGAGAERSSGQSAFELFRNSPTHDRVMLSPEFGEVGAARVHGGPYGWYWAVEFGLGTAASAASANTSTTSLTPRVHVASGANLVVWSLPDSDPASALQSVPGAGSVVYGYDAATGQWVHYSPSLPGYVQTLRLLRQGETYWFIATRAADIGP